MGAKTFMNAHYYPPRQLRPQYLSERRSQKWLLLQLPRLRYLFSGLSSNQWRLDTGSDMGEDAWRRRKGHFAQTVPSSRSHPPGARAVQGVRGQVLREALRRVLLRRLLLLLQEERPQEDLLCLHL
jgi:hypothetical protein